MEKLELGRIPVMETGMLIRRPPAEVFDAFVDPTVTTQFWFTHGSGRLVQGAQVEWRWAMYDISVPVTARLVEPHTRLVIEWPGYSGVATVEWTFKPLPEGTYVSVRESGYQGDGDALVRQVTDSTQGFSLTLAGAKAWLEHGVRLNLVADRYPKGLG